MSADTLVASGSPVVLTPPAPETSGSSTYAFSQVGFAVMGGNPDEVVVASYGHSGAVVSGYTLAGSLLFQTYVAKPSFNGTVDSVAIATDGGGGVGVTWQKTEYGSASGPSPYDGVLRVAADGSVGQQTFIGNWDNHQAQIFSTPTGFHLEWLRDMRHDWWNGSSYPWQEHKLEQQDFLASGAPAGSAVEAVGTQLLAYASTSVGGTSFQLLDNHVQLGGGISILIPGEPSGAITQAVAAGLSDGHTAAVAWVDSGTDYVSLFNSTTNSFGPVIGLDWGGAADLHVVALTDGGFAVSWLNGGAYKGELFDGAGNGGGVLSLTGQFAAIDSHGDLYTVGLNADGAEVVQTYAVSSAGASGGGSTGGGTGSGQTYTSDNAGDHWIGTAGGDVFHLGRGGDVVSGNGGNDTFAFAQMPWTGGHITDFGDGDRLDLTGLLSTTSETGSDALADGYLMLASDGAGGTDVYARYDTASSWWLVTDLDFVAQGRLQFSNGVFTAAAAPSHAVSTADPTYVAPLEVDTITLTGSHQTVTANNANETAIFSNNTGNQIHGGTADDTIHIGRAGDQVWGGYGQDVFAFAETPWAGAVIKDFSRAEGDSIDVTGLLAAAGYTGSNPVADGYLKQTISSGSDQIWANYHQPGNDGWWLVATVQGVSSPMTLTNGVFHLGPTSGTFTTSGNQTVPDGYDTAIVTGNGTDVSANNGGDTLIAQGVHQLLYGGAGNDTFVFAQDTRFAYGGGGVDTYVVNAHPTYQTSISDPLIAGEKIDLSHLMSAAGYTGNDPFGEGYLAIVNGSYVGPSDQHDIKAQLWFDPDGSAGAAAASLIVTMAYDPTREQFHYQDGILHVV